MANPHFIISWDIHKPKGALKCIRGNPVYLSWNLSWCKGNSLRLPPPPLPWGWSRGETWSLLCRLLLTPCFSPHFSISLCHSYRMLGGNSPWHCYTFYGSVCPNKLSRLFALQMSLEAGDNISPWVRGQFCFLTNIIKILSSSGVQVGQIS